MSNSLDTDHARRLVGSGLGPNCFHTSRQIGVSLLSALFALKSESNSKSFEFRLANSLSHFLH